jgi:hypothetical protein
MQHLEPPPTRTPPSAAELMDSVPGWVHGVRADELHRCASAWGEDHCRAAAWAIWRHGLGPVLAEGETLAVLPGALQAHLREDLRLGGERNAILLGDLGAVLDKADQAGIEVVPLKGSLLAPLYYDDPALRPMADLDLLVRAENQRGLIELAQERGYVLARERPRHTVLSREGKTASDVVRLGEHPDNPMNVEIHPRVAGDVWGLRYELTEAMWASSRPGSLLGSTARLLPPRVLMRHLLVHAATNMMDRTLRAIHLHDLTVLGPHLKEADWDALCNEAEGTAEARLLYAPLALADRWLGAQAAPPVVLARLRRESPARLTRFIREAPLAQMTICGFTWPRRGRIPWAWYAPGREWLNPVKHLLLPSAADVHRSSQAQSPQLALVAACLRRLWHAATCPARRLWCATRRAREADSGTIDRETR